MRKIFEAPKNWKLFYTDYTSYSSTTFGILINIKYPTRTKLYKEFEKIMRQRSDIHIYGTAVIDEKELLEFKLKKNKKLKINEII